ncbi:MAG: YbgC/FadM family acyl-CoA thioesterase [Candidatus Omnitrophota bacterium]|nr:YbgC/FadM family acyl-CoA thioesterase [Candidatus Omnitrophota bacterium]
MSKFYLEKRVYYHDTDCGGVVYYAAYLDHLEEARTEYLRGLGIDVAEYAARGDLFAVVHLEIDYKCPARYGDIIMVSAEIENIGNASIHFGQEVKRGNTLLAKARVVLACIDNKMKARRVPEDLKEKYEESRPK